MAGLRLSFATAEAPRLRPLLEGAVQPEGIELVTSVIPTGELFWRVAHFDPFDVAELSITGYMWGSQHGKEWVALPYLGFTFGAHTETLCNVDSGIERPEDLKGKRMGVPEYPVTAVTWAQYAFESQHGVRPQDISWYEERSDRASHYRLMGYRPPADTSVQYITDNKLLCDMLIAGEIDAVTRYFGAARQRGSQEVVVDRSNIPMDQLAAHPKVKWLYPDRKAAAIEYHRKIGHLQPTNCLIMKREVAERYPWAPLNLVNAISESCRLTADVDYLRPRSYKLTKEEQREVIGPDFWPVGVERNRPALQRLTELAYRAGFTVEGRQFTVEELFHESTLSV